MLFDKNYNKIYIHKEDGSVKQVHFVTGLHITFKGKNSAVHIYEPCQFKLQFGARRSHIKIYGNNNLINICSNNRCQIKSLRIRAIGSNNQIDIGKNLLMTDGVDIDFAHTDNMSLKIGEECVFGQNIKFMLGDHHSIYSIFDNKKLNNSKA